MQHEHTLVSPALSPDPDAPSSAGGEGTAISEMSEARTSATSSTGFVYSSYHPNDKYTLDQDPGIEVSPHTSPPTSPPLNRNGDNYFEGLQVYHPPNAGLPARHIVQAVSHQPEKGFNKIVTDVRSISPDHESYPEVSIAIPARRKNRKRRCIIIGVVAFIVVVIAAVGGGVGGTLAGKTKSYSDSSNNGASPGTSGSGSGSSNETSSGAPAARIQSTRGAYNGTGLAMMSSSITADSYYQCLAIYQSFTGALQRITIGLSREAVNAEDLSNVSNPVQVSELPLDLGVKAANGTALAGQVLQAASGKPETLVIIYADTDGTLTDLWSTRSNITTWTKGNLASRKFKTVLGGRGAMLLQQANCYGSNTKPTDMNDWGQTGMRLWAGHPDGMIHQYSYDFASSSWSSSDAPIKGTNAWGGIAMGRRSEQVSCFNNSVLIQTGQDGRTSFFTSTPGDSESALWPAGPVWSNPIVRRSNATSDPNSSIAFGLLDEYDDLSNFSVGNLLTIGNGLMLSTEADMDDTGNSTSLVTNEVIETAPVMSGSTLSSAGFQLRLNSTAGTGLNLIVYQSNGTSIQWALKGGDSRVGNVLW